MIKRTPMGRNSARIVRKAVKRPFKRSLGKKRGIAPKKRKQSKIALWRSWNVPDYAYHRYEGLRGVLWYWMSRDVRQSEFEKWDRRCLTCLGRLDDWRDGDCGHVIPSANCGEYLRFHRKNLTLQHKKCNQPRFTPDAGIRNAIHYNQRYGAGAIEALLALKTKKQKVPTKKQYEQLIKEIPAYQASLL